MNGDGSLEERLSYIRGVDDFTGVALLDIFKCPQMSLQDGKTELPIRETTFVELEPERLREFFKIVLDEGYVATRYRCFRQRQDIFDRLNRFRELSIRDAVSRLETRPNTDAYTSSEPSPSRRSSSSSSRRLA
ncbi:hypothetical protein [Rhodomicrobium udaipurense]|uniref:Uncharacterized protein n=1 Tax=Rhodomicrobium udaipurense TaxID=1202716 RepID=A0A8I1GBG1_9HYPH|nr:hypothetical protein [Rhodomicrobium udaipurense]MBJ7544008.1 hypothetical protein [Rhodomicrobium udaipurense]